MGQTDKRTEEVQCTIQRHVSTKTINNNW